MFHEPFEQCNCILQLLQRDELIIPIRPPHMFKMFLICLLLGIFELLQSCIRIRDKYKILSHLLFNTFDK